MLWESYIASSKDANTLTKHKQFEHTEAKKGTANFNFCFLT
jgi:hypothetical protein